MAREIRGTRAAALCSASCARHDESIMALSHGGQKSPVIRGQLAGHNPLAILALGG